MTEINLLSSTNLAPKPGVVKTSNTLKVTAVVLTIGFFVIVFLMVSFFIFNAISLRSSTNKQAQLTSSIKSLETVEQQYVLVKDRAQKIEAIFKEGNALDDFSNFVNMISSIPDGAAITSGKVSKGSVETQILVYNSAALTQTFSTLVSNENYNTVSLKSFSFSPKTGYSIEFLLKKT